MTASLMKAFPDAVGEPANVAEIPSAERRAIKKREVVYALTVLVIGILFFATAV